VLQEFYGTVTEKLRPGLDRDDAPGDVRSRLAWSPLPVDSRVIEAAWATQDRYRLSWWDGLIVAAAQIADCRYLLSEDLQADQLLGMESARNGPRCPFRPGKLIARERGPRRW
jgi:predicted nucleic acid-binding protein